MSTATPVPQTHELDDDDARETLRQSGRMQLAKDAFQRFRVADGFSHSRALAFQIVLTFLPGIIAFVGLISVINQEQLRQVAQRSLVAVAPGPASKILTQAFQQGTGTGAIPLLLGLIGTIIAGTTAMGQLERGANRIYGVERDRPTVNKYARGCVLACSAGLLSMVSFVLFVGGSALGQAARATGINPTLVTIWSLIRWPLGIVLVIAAFALLFRLSPRRKQPSASWLAHGSAVSAILWFAFTGLLSVYLTASKSFGQTYGPLAGIIGILLWALFTSWAVFLGLAFAAQLEAVRAGVPSPQTADERFDAPDFSARSSVSPA
jgi:YihY family inner membrane protein